MIHFDTSIQAVRHVADREEGDVRFIIGVYSGGNILRNWGSENEYFYQYNNGAIEEHFDMGAFTQIDDTHANFFTGSSGTSSNTVYYWYE